MAQYNFTDKKITQHTTDRRRYYAPTPFGSICPHLKVDGDGKPIIITDITGGVPHRKCVCNEATPVCSYHLMNTLLDKDTGETPFECHRYLCWYGDGAKKEDPVDTHERQLKIRSTSLDWY